MKRPFRIWLYPLPPLLAIAGFLYILVERPNFLREILGAGVVLVLGAAIYCSAGVGGSGQTLERVPGFTGQFANPK